ncbi:hypothetical protein GQ55_5G201700 [Panicum hallii var. hallii]|uniref:Uncharacterized protein n=1 Tax=Panicum hallii var. hallii TaxID=1504633 RepID=A0A2T7DI94_9POAL|nr:hypothetical protein GQ55_5G201700 [Panicum hallii var. hallii]
MRWSDHLGEATTVTPAASASAVEFHPQCVTKQPTAGCASTRSCAHHGTTLPRSRSRQAAARASAERSARVSSRTTHRNGRPVLASPAAISATSSESLFTRLPNATNTTDRGGRASSQAVQPPSSAAGEDSPSASSGSRSGPTGMTGKCSRSPSMVERSSSSKVFAKTHGTVSRARPRSATSI